MPNSIFSFGNLTGFSSQYHRHSIREGDILINWCSAQLISFEIDSISKEINCVEHEYMNISSPLIELATPPLVALQPMWSAFF